MRVPSRRRVDGESGVSEFRANDGRHPDPGASGLSTRTHSGSFEKGGVLHMYRRLFTIASAFRLPLAVACAVTMSGCERPPGSADAPREVLLQRASSETLSAVPGPTIDWTPETYAAPRVTTRPVMDGLLEEEEWNLAPWTSEFVDIRDDGGPAPRYRTRARMMWDERYFYVGAVLEEPDVWATLTERDAVIYHDNDFEVFIDPDGDTHLYYEIEINALATIWDLMLIRPYRDGGPAIDAWDIRGLEAAVHVDGSLNDPSDRDGGWSVEIAIPWDVLAEAAGRPAPPLPGDRWRVNFSRVEWRGEVRDGRTVKRMDPETGEPLDEDNWVWSPQGLIAMHYPEMWGIVEFVDRPGPGAGIPVAPPPNEVERTLWALRQVYYRQRQRADSIGSWATTVAALGLDEPAVEGVPWPPDMSVTPHGFEATLRLPDGRTAGIREDGRTWITD